MSTASILLAVASTIFGVILRYGFDAVRERYRFRRELKDNNSIDVTGNDWHAAWQTAVEKETLINTERICMKQKGGVVKVWNLEKSPENPKGGYRWESQLQFFHGKTLMGWYFPLKTENITSKGIMFLCYLSTKKTFYGKWVGSAYDGDLANGFLVISKDRNYSLTELDRVLKLHDDEVNIIFTNL